MVKLVVGNLPPSATNQSLKEIFHEYEDLQDFKLISNYGFVYLESEASANHAVHNLNGFEYRGFQVTVDFVGDSRNKSKPITQSESNQFPKPSVPAQKRFATPMLEQTNPNPYNISFSNGNSRSFDMSNEKNPNPYNLPFAKNNNVQKRPFNSSEMRNTDPYNTPYPKINNNAQRSLPLMSDQRFRPQPYDEYGESMYNSMGYGRKYGPTNEDSYGVGAPYDDYSQPYGDYGQQYDDYNSQYYNYPQQYLSEEDYYMQQSPMKRMRPSPYMDDGYGYAPRRPMSYKESDPRQYGTQQPGWVDKRPMTGKHSYLHACDEPYYRPRGKQSYQPKKSYIDEYEDDQDYTEVDPYPAYLKQYKK